MKLTTFILILMNPYLTSALYEYRAESRVRGLNHENGLNQEYKAESRAKQKYRAESRVQG